MAAFEGLFVMPRDHLTMLRDPTNFNEMLKPAPRAHLEQALRRTSCATPSSDITLDQIHLRAPLRR